MLRLFLLFFFSSKYIRLYKYKYVRNRDSGAIRRRAGTLLRRPATPTGGPGLPLGWLVSFLSFVAFYVIMEEDAATADVKKREKTGFFFLFRRKKTNQNLFFFLGNQTTRARTHTDTLRETKRGRDEANWFCFSFIK